VRVARIERGLVRVTFPDDADDAGNTRDLAAGMIKKGGRPFSSESRSMLRAW
jgi:hypothetical protein